MGAVWVYGMMYGNPKLITIGWDGNDPQRGCGYTVTHGKATHIGLPDHPYLYFAKGPNQEQVK